MKLNISLCSLLLMSTSVLANGQGYNGPDLTPISIPGQLDRGISVKQIGDAINICLVNGDAAQGLKSVAAELADQMGITPTSSHYDNPATLFQDLPLKSILPGGQFWGSFIYQAETGEGAGTSPVSYGLTFQVQGYGIPNTFLSTTVPFPFISFDKVLSDGSYDDYGNLMANSQIVSGLNIQMSSDTSVDMSKLPLMNTGSHVMSKFTVNALEYAQCLQSQVQRQINGSK